MHPDWRRICDEYMQATSYSPEEFETFWNNRDYDPKNRPETYLTYPDAVVRVPLGEPQLPDGPDFWSVLRERRSKRNFLPESITLSELNALLWGCQGITAGTNRVQKPRLIQRSASSTALSTILGFWVASPSPMFTTIFETRGTWFTFPYPNSSQSFGMTSFW